MTDREKAIEILQRLADGKAEELYIFDDEGGDVCGQILKEQDAILAGIEALKERPHGEAIYKVFDEESGVSNTYWCSCCGFPIVQVYMSFCGNCGAKLKKEGEAE